MLSCVESRSRGDAWRCTVVHGNAQRARTTVVVVTGPRVHARLSVCARAYVFARLVVCARVRVTPRARVRVCSSALPLFCFPEKQREALG